VRGGAYAWRRQCRPIVPDKWLTKPVERVFYLNFRSLFVGGDATQPKSFELALPWVPPSAWRTEEAGSEAVTLGGVMVIIGIVIAIFWSLLVGIIVALIGWVDFGGSARGRWY
jgi:hypothetical protein